MLIGEPPPTQADVHFRLFGIPVRIHPYFWITTLLLGMGGFRAGKADPSETLIWVVVVFVSILVHELGHATMQRAYGGHPWITLYGLGGLASCNDCSRSPWRQIAISLAGPAAGFLLAALVISILMARGHYLFVLDWIPIRWLPIDAQQFAQRGTYGLADRVVWDLLQVNILWGLINLLPVYPLDGGHIARELFTLGNPRAGIIQSLQLSAGIAVLIAAYAIIKQDFFLALMFGYLAYSSFQTLQMYRNHWR
jgi:stage IV sporulation protein FB